MASQVQSLSVYTGMKQQLEDQPKTLGKVRSISPKTTRRIKKFVSVRVKAPRTTACELPILWALSRTPEAGIQTKKVIQEVIAKWFSLLDVEDRNARYPASRKKITESVIKFARKNLVLKGEIFPIGEGQPQGIWRLTAKGMLRAQEEKGDAWIPRYSNHDAILVLEETS